MNGKRQRVWANGKQVHGSSMERDATPGWRTVFAIARTIALRGGGSQSIADRISIPLDDVRAAMPLSGRTSFTLRLDGKQPTGRPLCDWALAAYPGYGGIRTCWRRDTASTRKRTSSLHWVA